MAGEGFKLDKLTADNFHSWKFNMKMFLIGKDLWDLVEGTETLGEEATEDKKEKIQEKRKFVIINYLSFSKFRFTDLCPKCYNR